MSYPFYEHIEILSVEETKKAEQELRQALQLLEAEKAIARIEEEKRREDYRLSLQFNEFYCFSR